MKTLVAVSFFLLLFATITIPTYASNHEFWLQVGGISKHTSPHDPLTGIRYNQRHPGVGLEWHTTNYYFSVGEFKNSFNKKLTYAIVAKQWKNRLSKNTSINFQFGGGAYKYGQTVAEYERVGVYYGDILVGSEEQRRLVDVERRGLLPWLSTSMTYKNFGANIAFIPSGLLGDIQSAITVQFKLKIQ
jgi:hypothetical protein